MSIFHAYHGTRPPDTLAGPPPDALVKGESCLPIAVAGRAQVAHQVEEFALGVGVQATSDQFKCVFG